MLDSFGNAYDYVIASTRGNLSGDYAARVLAEAANISGKVIASFNTSYNYGMTISFPNVVSDGWSMIGPNLGRVRLHPQGAYSSDSYGPIIYTGNGSGLNENIIHSIFSIKGTNLQDILLVTENSKYEMITNNDFIIIYSQRNRVLTFAGYLRNARYNNDMRGLVLAHIGVTDKYIFRAADESYTSLKTDIQIQGEANYPIICASDAGAGTNPGSEYWATDFVLKDVGTNEICGRVPNILLAKGSNYIANRIYMIEEIVEGNTEIKTWKCLDLNFGTDKLLMRYCNV